MNIICGCNTFSCLYLPGLSKSKISISAICTSRVAIGILQGREITINIKSGEFYVLTIYYGHNPSSITPMNFSTATNTGSSLSQLPNWGQYSNSKWCEWHSKAYGREQYCYTKCTTCSFQNIVPESVQLTSEALAKKSYKDAKESKKLFHIYWLKF